MAIQVESAAAQVDYGQSSAATILYLLALSWAVLVLLRAGVRRNRECRNRERDIQARYRRVVDHYSLTAMAHGLPAYWVPDDVRRTPGDLAWRLACKPAATVASPTCRRGSLSDAVIGVAAFTLLSSRR